MPTGAFCSIVSFVDSADNRWRIDVLEADTPAQFDPASRRPVLTAADIHAEGVKDPYVINVGGLWHMIASYAPTPVLVDDPAREAMHATADVYNTGIAKSSTGLAVSADGRNWEWQGDIFAPRERGWDSYCSRISSLVRVGQQWLAFYDGSADVSQNYEEQCGLALVCRRCATLSRLSVNWAGGAIARRLTFGPLRGRGAGGMKNSTSITSAPAPTARMISG